MTRHDPLVLGLALVAIAIGSLTCFGTLVYHAHVVERLDRFERTLEARMMTSKWTSGGVERTLTTVRREGESIEDLLARHDADLAAAMRRYPRDTR